MSALPSKADIGTGTRVSPSTHQLRQLGDIRREPLRLNGQNRQGRDSDE